MPVVNTPRGHMVTDAHGNVVAGPFPTLEAATAVDDKFRILAAKLAAKPKPPASGPGPVAIRLPNGKFVVTAGDGTGTPIAGPFATSAEAEAKAKWLRQKAAEPPVRTMNITPGYRSPDVIDSRNSPYEEVRNGMSDRRRMELGLRPPIPGISDGPSPTQWSDPEYIMFKDLRDKYRREAPGTLPPEVTRPDEPDGYLNFVRGLSPPSRKPKP